MSTLLMRRRGDPATCIICGRRAIAIGVHERGKPLTLFTCNEIACIQSGPIGASMRKTDLDRIEASAIAEACKAVAADMVSDAMMSLYTLGKDSISECQSEDIDAAASALVNDGILAARMTTALLAYGEAVAKQINGGNPPF